MGLFKICGSKMYQVFEEHPFFGIFLARKSDTVAFTRRERVFFLCGFLGTNAFVTCLVALAYLQMAVDTVKLTENQVCKCVRENWDVCGGGSIGDNMILPPNYYDKNNSSDGVAVNNNNNYTWTQPDYPISAVDIPPEGFDDIRVCCLQYVNDNNNVTLEFSEYQPCPDVATTLQTTKKHWYMMPLSGLLSSTLSMFALNPLVEWLLRREGRCFNPFAYVLIVLQIILGIGFTLNFVLQANSYGLPAGRLLLAEFISFLYGLFVFSILQGMLLELCIKPCLFRKCYGREYKDPYEIKSGAVPG